VIRVSDVCAPAIIPAAPRENPHSQTASLISDFEGFDLRAYDFKPGAVYGVDEDTVIPCKIV
jgi:hypothetical protein